MSKVLWTYLGASGQAINFEHNWLDPDHHTEVADNIDLAFKSSQFVQNLCSGGCCSVSGTTAVGKLVQAAQIRGKRYFSQQTGETPGWFAPLIGPIKEQLVVKENSDLILNPYYGAFGGITANSTDQSSARIVSSTGSISEIELTTPVEYYDYFDWMYGGCGAGGIATGTHPQNMRVGHFIAIEKAGKAKPFNWYSYAEITIDYSVICTGSQALLTKRGTSVHSRPATNPPIQLPCNTPTQWNSPNFVDNWTMALTNQLQRCSSRMSYWSGSLWSESLANSSSYPKSAVKQKNYDPLFPTEKEMDANGNIK